MYFYIYTYIYICISIARVYAGVTLSFSLKLNVD